MPRYAAQTRVNTDASQAELRRMLQRYGADQFMFGEATGCGDEEASPTGTHHAAEVADPPCQRLHLAVRARDLVEPSR